MRLKSKSNLASLITSLSLSLSLSLDLNLNKIYIPRNFDNMLHIQLALTGVIPCISRIFEHSAWKLSFREYFISIDVCIRYLHKLQVYMVLRSLQSVSHCRSLSLSVNRFGRQFQPTFWCYSFVRLHIIHFIHMLTIVCAVVVCVCVFFLSCRFKCKSTHII